ncbi:MAG: xanthine dehydrogenase family protein molybdopterin-binding subunit [Alphaproteobacteria bacterium]|nr:xanthine dehydrogenase family protein molybdopterin-binding subunit [Alphaproteobacteria bacterium]
MLDKTAENGEFKVIGTRPERPDGVDKVTGRARFGADMVMPGMLIGKVLRSPHAHANIKSIDTSAAEALEGVKAVITAADFTADVPEAEYDTMVNCIAHGKALYDGHGVAAVAATSRSIANKALKLIKVEYEVLPHVTDVEEACKDDAPLLHDNIFTEGLEETPTTPSNISGRVQFGHGDVDEGFAAADKVVERKFRTEATHQGYIEPHACVGNLSPDGTGELWCCTQGHFMVRNSCAAILGLDISRLRVTASEIGGGFGGKTTIFIEPLALALSRKAGRPVKLVMSRDEVFRATGPTSSASMWIKIGAKNDGTITAMEGLLKYQGGAFKGSWVSLGCMTAFACYRADHMKTVGYDVLVNRPRAAAYRAPGAPMAAFAVESVVTELAGELGRDPLEFRLQNAAKEGDQSSYGPKHRAHGLMETLEQAKAHDHYNAPLGPNQGRGVACGFWFNFGGQTSTSLNIGADGTVNVSVGTVDVGGSRASMCLMVAEELGVPYEKVRCVVADTSSLGHNDITDGSRTTFSSGMALILSARDAKQKLCARAAKIWEIPEDAVEWVDGHARPAGPNAGEFDPMSLAEVAGKAETTGGPIAGHHECNARGAGVSFATHMVDTEVDPETGRVTVLRYTVFQDAGKAIHPAYVEGQFQGGAVQGIGWAINEEYIYGEDGRLQNAGFLDYRIPVASDLPMIDTVIIETPNKGHPYGVRGVGETSIVPPMAAIANSVSAAAGVRLTELPMSPPRVLKAMDDAKA